MSVFAAILELEGADAFTARPDLVGAALWEQCEVCVQRYRPVGRAKYHCAKKEVPYGDRRLRYVRFKMSAFGNELYA
ncbi:MAG: hypothetical protein GF363_01585 [Chitinivibrionales bacterium]|nr:hypothetical protein [Chitinivibrionales bacterium]